MPLLWAGRAGLWNPRDEKAAERAAVQGRCQVKRRGKEPQAAAQICQSWDTWPKEQGGGGEGVPKNGSETVRPLQPLRAPRSQRAKEQRGHRKPGVDNEASVVSRASAFLRHERRRPGEGSEGAPLHNGKPHIMCVEACQPLLPPPSAPPLPSTGPWGI